MEDCPKRKEPHLCGRVRLLAIKRYRGIFDDALLSDALDAIAVTLLVFIWSACK